MALTAAVSIQTAADAADIGPQIPAPQAPVVPVAPASGNGVEIRVGGFAHGVGSPEKNTGDISVGLVLPSLLANQQSWWAVFIPRPYFGAMISIPHRSDSVRGGALWRFPIWEGWFAEGFLGGAYDDGSINGGARRNAIGTHVLFNAGGSLGYHIDQHWSILATFDHLSNGNNVFRTGVANNLGVNDYGLQISYAF